MATWTTIADARLEPDKPARSIDAIALRDNPIAIAENAPNAPKVEQYYELITVSGNWTVPKTGRYQIDLIGGGGGGGSGTGGGGAGGGGGSGFVVSIIANLNQGDVYPLIVGGGGGGGLGGGGGGGASTGFGYTANGGSGGFTNSSPVAAFGGVSGQAAFPSSGGRGANAPFAVAGVDAAPSGSGVSGGVGYGAGGGGGYGGGTAGGGGAQGAVIIRGI